MHTNSGSDFANQLTERRNVHLQPAERNVTLHAEVNLVNARLEKRDAYVIDYDEALADRDQCVYIELPVPDALVADSHHSHASEISTRPAIPVQLFPALSGIAVPLRPALSRK